MITNRLKNLKLLLPIQWPGFNSSRSFGKSWEFQLQSFRTDFFSSLFPVPADLEPRPTVVIFSNPRAPTLRGDRLAREEPLRDQFCRSQDTHRALQGYDQGEASTELLERDAKEGYEINQDITYIHYMT